MNGVERHWSFQTSWLGAEAHPESRNPSFAEDGDRRLVNLSSGRSERSPERRDRKQLADRPAGAMPPIHRVSMVPSEIDRNPLRRWWRRLWARRARAAAAPRADAIQPAWQQAGTRRRIVLALLVAAQTAFAAWSLTRTFPTPALSALEIIIVTFFSILFSWISFSFLANLGGFWTLWRKRPPPWRLDACEDATGVPLRGRTALVMPICNEDVPHCFAGIAAIYQSLADTRQLDKFDFFILSDSSEAARQSEESRAWEQTCCRLNAFGRIFYRHRRSNIKRKSGNIADFLRRWSKNYDYMIVLDADSLMSGEIIVRLARMMDLAPQVGIIQTAPVIVNRESLFARVQQFASRVYGPLFSASLRFWQLGESYYWGHNAIIRVAPFVKHCGLARLPGEPPLGGEVLSHDFVEAALMGRTGLEVWLADEWVGSYEESPPNALDELKRDRRWCQGNLQHLRLLFGAGIRFGHRAIMAMGIMAYASALLWAVFLLLSCVEVGVQFLATPNYFPSHPSLFPTWPVWHPEIAIALLTTTGVLLVLPKFLSFILIVKNRQSAGFRGPLRLAIGIILEIIFSTLVAPLRMWFHSKFVLLTLLGRQIKWSAQRRNGSETSWREAIRRHGVSTLFSMVCTGAALYWNSTLAWWLLPVSVSLMLAIPLSVWSSRVSFGQALKRWGIFAVPEEDAPPVVVARLKEWTRQEHRDDRSSGRGVAHP